MGHFELSRAESFHSLSHTYKKRCKVAPSWYIYLEDVTPKLFTPVRAGKGPNYLIKYLVTFLV